MLSNSEVKSYKSIVLSSYESEHIRIWLEAYQGTRTMCQCEDGNVSSEDGKIPMM